MTEERTFLFDEQAARYDRWFKRAPGRLQFAGEVAALRMVLKDTPRPWLEVGVGTGQFAGMLDVDVGVDPSRAMLHLAHRRGVAAAQGIGESLPVRSGSLGCVLLITTLCFVSDQPALLREARRALRREGVLVVADIPRTSSWGSHYQRQRSEGHPLYKHMELRSLTELEDLLLAEGFEVTDRACSVTQPPGKVRLPEQAWWGNSTRASFVAVRARPRAA